MAGGIGARNATSVECYDPKDQQYHPDGSLQIQRCMHSGVLLKDGRVLLAGGLGETEGPWPTELEIYDPRSHRSEIVGHLDAKASYPSMVLLQDGTVFIGGLGYRDHFAARFDPRSQQIRMVGSEDAGPMAETAATRLASGEVLVTGWGSSGRNAFLFDPTTDRLTAVGPMRHSRFGHASLLLSDGRVLVAGGFRVSSIEVYDPATRTFQEPGELGGAISKPHMALLPDGKVLIIGGAERGSMKNYAGLFDPITGHVETIEAPQGFYLTAGMTKGPDGLIWFVSDMGAVAKFDPRTHAWH
jgi:hypothetical protein